MRIAEIIEFENQNVLIHCSDGWDRTPQISALAQIILDSYYRTIEGLAVLIEKEWLSFGHKFHDRIGHGQDNHLGHEISPIFLQFLDAVWQITQQAPRAFEFNERLLLKSSDGSLYLIKYF